MLPMVLSENRIRLFLRNLFQAINRSYRFIIRFYDSLIALLVVETD